MSDQPETTAPVAATPRSEAMVLGAPGSVVKSDTSQSVAATVKSVPNGATVFVRTESAVREAQQALEEAGKTRCHVVLNPKLGAESLWRHMSPE